MSDSLFGSSANRKTVELGIRIAVFAVLLLWCVRIVSPFMGVMVWAAIITVSMYPGFCWLRDRLGGRPRLAAGLWGLLGLLVMALPAFLFADTVIEGSRAIAERMHGAQWHLPPPPASVGDIPLVGSVLQSNWQMAADNLPQLLQEFRPQLQEAGKWLANMGAQAGLGFLQFLFSIVVAAVLLSYADASAGYAQRFARRLLSEQGAHYLDLAVRTTRSVAKGILGVALIQSMLAGLGMLVAGVPGAGLLTILCVLFCVAQLGPGLVLIPCAVWMFYSASQAAAIAFLIWSVLVILTDNILKPLLLGRGVNVPMLVIFIGAIGGFLSNGFIGLFVGAIVLVLGYTVLQAWLTELPAEDEPGKA